MLGVESPLQLPLAAAMITLTGATGAYACIHACACLGARTLARTRTLTRSAHDARVCAISAQKAGVELAGQIHVGGVATAAGDQAQVFAAVCRMFINHGDLYVVLPCAHGDASRRRNYNCFGRRC